MSSTGAADMRRRGRRVIALALAVVLALPGLIPCGTLPCGTASAAPVPAAGEHHPASHAAHAPAPTAPSPVAPAPDTEREPGDAGCPMLSVGAWLPGASAACVRVPEPRPGTRAAFGALAGLTGVVQTPDPPPPRLA